VVALLNPSRGHLWEMVDKTMLAIRVFGQAWVFAFVLLGLTPIHANASGQINFITTPDGFYIEDVRIEKEENILLFCWNNICETRLSFDDSAEQEIEYVLRNKENRTIGTIRYFSPALYRSLGQSTGSVFVYTDGIYPDQSQATPNSGFPGKYPQSTNLTLADKRFAMSYQILQNRNTLSSIPQYRDINNVSAMISGILNKKCYVDCTGMSFSVASFIKAESRIVTLYSKSKYLGNNHRFYWSAGHNNIEIKKDGKWYVADPTYGFAYVKDGEGNRLDSIELIKRLSGNDIERLTFGMVANMRIYDVSALDMMKFQPSIRGLYFTPDKKLKYRSKVTTVTEWGNVFVRTCASIFSYIEKLAIDARLQIAQLCNRLKDRISPGLRWRFSSLSQTMTA
jgi:hypothetical protein